MTATSAPLLSVDFWRGYWITVRPYLFFVSGSAAWAGLALPGRLTLAEQLPPLATFLLSYGLGQALTDVFQVDTDTISSPYRPLTQGRIAKSQVLGVSLAGLLGCTVVWALYSPWTLAVSALGVTGLATYTFFKRRWWGGPLWNAWIVALLPFAGALCAGWSPRTAVSSGPLWLLIGGQFFGYAVFVLIGYFKDVSADRATGYRTFPVVFGRRPSILVSALFAIAALCLGALLLRRHEFSWGALVLFAVGGLALARAHLRLLLGTGSGDTIQEQDAHGPITDTVRAFILMNLAQTVAARPSFVFAAIPLYAAFEVVLALRPERSQI